METKLKVYMIDWFVSFSNQEITLTVQLHSYSCSVNNSL